MLVYHEVNRRALPRILREGIKRGAEGAKTDAPIRRTDAFLDSCLPPELAAQGVSRRNSIYAYLSDGECVIDITDGRPRSISQLAKQRANTALVSIEVDPVTCFVSDLDAYDAVKRALQAELDPASLAAAAGAYWRKLIRLDRFRPGSSQRPEVLIPHNIAPGALAVTNHGR